MDRITLGDALTFWMVPHPAWTPNREWPKDVGFVTWASADTFVFIDPLVRDDLDPRAWEQFDDAASAAQRVAVLLTAPWHERSVRAVSGRYDAPVWIHQRGRARIADLPELSTVPNGVRVFQAGGVDEGQVAFHIVPERTLVVAEFFLGTNRGLRVAPSPATRNLDAFTASLDELPDLPIDRVLVAHGPPVLSDGSIAIRDALDTFSNEASPSRE